MPDRPIFALLIMTLLSFPVALLAQEVVQTQKFNYPLASTSGSINADCTDLAGDGLLHTTTGSITPALPRSADALIDATTTVGRINSNLSADKVNKEIVGETLEAKLGAGSHHLEAKTTNGTISLEAR